MSGRRCCRWSRCRWDHHDLLRRGGGSRCGEGGSRAFRAIKGNVLFRALRSIGGCLLNDWSLDSDGFTARNLGWRRISENAISRVGKILRALHVLGRGGFCQRICERERGPHEQEDCSYYRGTLHTTLQNTSACNTSDRHSHVVAPHTLAFAREFRGTCSFTTFR